MIKESEILLVVQIVQGLFEHAINWPQIYLCYYHKYATRSKFHERIYGVSIYLEGRLASRSRLRPRGPWFQGLITCFRSSSLRTNWLQIAVDFPAERNAFYQPIMSQTLKGHSALIGWRELFILEIELGTYNEIDKYIEVKFVSYWLFSISHHWILSSFYVILSYLYFGVLIV